MNIFFKRIGHVESGHRRKRSLHWCSLHARQWQVVSCAAPQHNTLIDRGRHCVHGIHKCHRGPNLLLHLFKRNTRGAIQGQIHCDGFVLPLRCPRNVELFSPKNHRSDNYTQQHTIVGTEKQSCAMVEIVVLEASPQLSIQDLPQGTDYTVCRLVLRPQKRTNWQNQ